MANATISRGFVGGVSLRMAFGFLLVTAVFGIGSSIAQASWSPASEVSAAGQVASEPKVAIGPDGSTTIVWIEYNASTEAQNVMAATRLPGSSTFSEPQMLSAPTAETDQAQVATGADGVTTVVWEEEGASAEIFASTRDQGSSEFSIPEQLSTPEEGGSAPRIATGPDGTVAVSWFRVLSTTPEFTLGVEVALRPGGADQDFSDPILLSQEDRSSLLPDVAIGSKGTVSVAWSAQEESGDFGVQIASRPPGSVDFSDPLDLASDADAPHLAMGIGDSTTVIWSSAPAGDETNLQAITRLGDTGPFSAPVDLAQPGTEPWSEEISMAPDGATTVVWVGPGEGGSLAVSASTRPGTSESFAEPVLVGESEDFFLFSPAPQVASGPTGSTTVAWRSLAGSDAIVQASTRARTAGAFGPPVALSPPGQFADDVDIAVGPCRQYATAAWVAARDEGDRVIQQASKRVADCTPALARPRLVAPRRVRQNRKATFRVRIRNSGDAQVTGLRIKAKGRGARANRRAGALAPARTKTVKIPIRFRKKGKVRVTFTVISSNAGRKVVRKTVRVR